MRFFSRPLQVWLAAGTFSFGVLGTVIPAQERSRGAESPDYVDGNPVARGEVLIRLRNNTIAEMTSIGQLVLADRLERVGSSGWMRLHSGSHSPVEIVRLLSRRSEIEAIEPNLIVRAVKTPNDPYLPLLWGLINPSRPGNDIHSSGAWDVSTGARDVVVGIVDTGIDYTHPDLAPNVWSAPAPFSLVVGGRQISCPTGSHGFNAIAFTCDPSDDHWHGTHVAGTIGAAGNNGIGVVGVNWAASIMGLKFLDSSGTGTVADAINAIEFAVQVKTRFGSTGGANVRVLSNSWSADQLSHALADEIERSRQADILFVAAAGNDAKNTDIAPVSPAGENVSNIVAVAASTDTDTLASFSNYGGFSVDIAAPGVNVLSTVRGGSYGYASGTSMATPHVAGAAALMLSACSLTTSQLKETLLNSIDAVAGLFGVVSNGGRLNIDRAIKSCVPSTPPPPVPLASASFVRVDTNTAGNWVGVYGSEGYAINQEVSAYPGYAQVAISDGFSYTWDADTADNRALLRASGTGRLAATWYGETFTIDFDFVDGAVHQVAVYSVDWDSTSRSERFDVMDATSGAILDSRTLTSFHGGQYVIWNLKGHTKLKATRTAGANAVASAIFFDPEGGSSGVPSSSASFSGLDTTTQGNWKGTYGTEGYGLINDSFSYPTSVQVTTSNALVYTWTPATSDSRALQLTTGTDRQASTWYGDNFSFGLDFTDGLPHRLAIYAVDWDQNARAQQVQIVDAVSGAVLSTQTLSSFLGGNYLLWTVKGPVIVNVLRLTGPNAVVSGLFFD